MSDLITAEKIIKEATKRGIDLGKGSPYNRLRYYTKIGWLPHMERRKDAKGKVVGHYPNWVIDRLEKIEEMKKEGLSNEQIAATLESHNTKRTLGEVFSFLNSPEKRLKTITYISFFAVLLILATEIGLIKVGKLTKQELIQNSINTETIPNQIVDTGFAVVPTNERVIYIKSTTVTPQSKIYISFEDNISPANKYWISKKVTNEGFYIELDSPVAQDAKVSWWITL